MGNIILWTMFGALGGWVAYIMAADMKLLSLGNYIVLGVLGGVAGGAITLLFGGSLTDYNGASQLTAILGAGSVLMATYFLNDTSS